MKRIIEGIKENLIDVIGIVIGITLLLEHVGVLKEGFTFFTSAWFILGCLWISWVIFKVFKKKSVYTACVLFFPLIFLLNYAIGSALSIYEFKPIGLLYWYFVGVIAGSVIYFLQKRRKKKKLS